MSTVDDEVDVPNGSTTIIVLFVIILQRNNYSTKTQQQSVAGWIDDAFPPCLFSPLALCCSLASCVSTITVGDMH